MFYIFDFDYNNMGQKKKKDEKFPDLIKHMISEEEKRVKPHKIMDLAGAFGENSEEWDDIEKKLYADRLRPSSRREITFEI